jgi:hypothetical protein
VTFVDRLPPLERRGSLGKPIPLDTRHSVSSCQAGVALHRSTPATAATGSATPACSCSSSRVVLEPRSSRRPRWARRTSSMSTSTESRASGSAGATRCTSRAVHPAPPATC